MNTPRGVNPLELDTLQFIKKILISPRLPFLFFHLPTVPYLAWLTLKSRSLFWYTFCNPICGPLHRPGKWKMLKDIPAEFLPKMILIDPHEDADSVVDKAAAAEIYFPMIAKPDRGERGRGVVKLKNLDQLRTYLRESHGPVMLQEWLDLPHEMGILYVRYPGESKGRVTSVSRKDMPVVVGDGVSSIETLAKKGERMRLFIAQYRARHGEKMDEVLPKGQSFCLDYVAQPGRGTIFRCAQEYNTAQLAETCERIFANIPGFYFGRADFKIADPATLAEGKGIYILELNATASIPLHMYDMKYSLFEMYGIMLAHWRHIFEIAKRNRANGGEGMTLANALRYLRERFKEVTAAEAVREEETEGHIKIANPSNRS